ncbi:hypothetical protein ACHAXA_004539 [Cyclostephanos tholiformis]|uniref:Uncharacterized protein n=1 Tax=Cyclostephanos tholiformis TaxID=382380 RepID=A0ABD3RF96_9STRA
MEEEKKTDDEQRRRTSSPYRFGGGVVRPTPRAAASSWTNHRRSAAHEPPMPPPPSRPSSSSVESNDVDAWSSRGRATATSSTGGGGEMVVEEEKEEGKTTTRTTTLSGDALTPVPSPAHAARSSWSAVVKSSKASVDTRMRTMTTTTNTTTTVAAIVEDASAPSSTAVSHPTRIDEDCDAEYDVESTMPLLECIPPPPLSFGDFHGEPRPRAGSLHDIVRPSSYGTSFLHAPPSPRRHIMSSSSSTIETSDVIRTASVSALHNDIGTLLARSRGDHIDRAMRRYRMGIDSAIFALASYHRRTSDDRAGNDTYASCVVNVHLDDAMEEGAEELDRIRRRLLRGDNAPTSTAAAAVTSHPHSAEDAILQNGPTPDGYSPPPDSPRRVRGDYHLASRPVCPLSAPECGRSILPLSRSSYATRSFRRSDSVRPIAAAAASVSLTPPLLDDIVHDIHQHQKLDCPDEAVYSCNGLTPLGLEYICDPLPVLGSLTSRRRRRLQFESSSSSDRSSNSIADDEAIMLEYVALIASRLNLASLEYRNAGGGVGEGLRDVLATLELASRDCQRARTDAFVVDNYDHHKAVDERPLFVRLFGLLEAVVHSNIGTVRYRLNRVRDSLASYEAAEAALEGDVRSVSCEEGRNIDDISSVAASEDGDDSRGLSESHSDDRFPPRDYLLLVVRLNMSRVLLRLNRPEDASKYRDMICTDGSRPHNRKDTLRRSRSSHAAASPVITKAMVAYEHDVVRRINWLRSVAEHYIAGLIHESTGEPSGYKEAWHHYNRLLSLARVKLDHRHAYICALLERRGSVLFEQRKLQCSMLSYLACLKILEHQQSKGSNVFNGADLSRILYAVARVLHDKEEYHDALHMYKRALTYQRAIAADSRRPSLDVITTLCNISRVHHLSGEVEAALVANREVLDLTLILVGGKADHPFLIHRLKVEGNILVEAGRLEEAMKTFVDAARRCSEDGLDRMMAEMMGESQTSVASSQEDAAAGDSSVLSIRSAAALAQLSFFHPAAAAA